MEWSDCFFPTVPKASHFNATLDRCLPFVIHGRVIQVDAHRVLCQQLPLPLGCICEVLGASGKTVPLEVVKHTEVETVLEGVFDKESIEAGDLVRLKHTCRTIPAGDQVLGCTLTPFGEPFGPPRNGSSGPRVAVDRDPPVFFERPPSDQSFTTGVAWMDSDKPICKGHRSAVVLESRQNSLPIVSQLIDCQVFDTCVLASIACDEEARNSLESTLQHRARSRGRNDWTLVVADSNRPRTEQFLAVRTATALAEYFRDCGKDVLLLADFSAWDWPDLQARCEDATSISESELLTKIVARIGRTRRGSVTGFFLFRESRQVGTAPLPKDEEQALETHWHEEATRSPGTELSTPTPRSPIRSLEGIPFDHTFHCRPQTWT